MNLKKLAISDQFPCYVSSRRRKVVSGFGLGVVTFFIVLSLVLFNIYFKTPFSNPIFQGFGANRNHNSTKNLTISWPFSFSSITSFSSSSSNSSSSLTINGTELQNSVGERVLDKTLEGNSSEMGRIEKSVDLEETPVRNLDKTLEGNSSKMGKSGKTVDLRETQLRNRTENVKNGSFIVIPEKKIEGKVDGKNASGISDNGKSFGKEGVALEKGNTGILSLKDNVTISDNGNRSYGECDIFDGRWVRDDTKPYYPAGSCPYIDRDFDCHLNKRLDNEFVKWKWQPYGCDIPSLNATDFLERLRGKKLVFVGDSLNRNMWESLVCILRHSVKHKKRVYEITGRHEFKKKGFYAFRFEDYNCSVDFVGAPFLVRESSFNGKNGTLETLRLDLMDRTTSMYDDADVLVFNTGHWWTHEKTSRGEDYYQEGKHVYPRLKVLDAYTRALATWARWVDKNIDVSRTQVIFRGYSVTHFRGGQWNSGGQCHKETEPIFNKAHLAKYPSKMRALEYVLQGMKTPIIYLNISRLTDYRKDGHPSIYRMKYKSVEEQIAAEHSQDCSHWCLPGVPDTWNELLYASLLKVGRGSWKS